MLFRSAVVAAFDHAAQPLDLLFELFAVADAFFFVEPVRGDAEFGVFVHFAGTDLHFDDAVFRADERGVQGLVAVRFGVGDVIVKFGGDRLPQVINDGEDAVAICFGFDFDAHGADVVELFEAQALALHFQVDAVDVFDAAIEAFDVYTGVGQFVAQQVDDAVDVALAVHALAFEFAGDFLVDIGFEGAQGAVFKFAFELGDAEANLTDRKSVV